MGGSVAPRPAAPASSMPQITPQQPQDDDYTSRLLKAKKRVWDERKDKQE